PLSTLTVRSAVSPARTVSRSTSTPKDDSLHICYVPPSVAGTHRAHRSHTEYDRAGADPSREITEWCQECAAHQARTEPSPRPGPTPRIATYPGTGTTSYPRGRSMERRLVITADDLGVDADTNATIIDLLREGLVSATTLIPVAAAAQDAVRRVLEAGLPAPRLHLTLSSAREMPGWRPLAPGVGSLTAPDGTFPVDAGLAERRATLADLATELRAQLRWMHDAGLRPAGLDSHSGTLYGLRGRPRPWTSAPTTSWTSGCRAHWPARWDWPCAGCAGRTAAPWNGPMRCGCACRSRWSAPGCRAGWCSAMGSCAPRCCTSCGGCR